MISDCADFQIFFLKRQNANASVMYMGAKSHSHNVSEAYHKLKKSQSFVVRRLEKMLDMMSFGIFKQLIAKNRINMS